MLDRTAAVAGFIANVLRIIERDDQIDRLVRGHILRESDSDGGDIVHRSDGFKKGGVGRVEAGCLEANILLMADRQHREDNVPVLALSQVGGGNLRLGSQALVQEGGATPDGGVADELGDQHRKAMILF